MNINACIVCDSKDNLNTSMNIKHDEKDYKVFLCDEHAETTTPKMAKDSLVSRIAKIDALMKQCKELGIEVSINQGGLSTAKKVDQSVKPIDKAVKVDGKKARLSTARNILDKPVESVAGSGGGVSLESHQSINIDEMVSGEIKEAMKKGDVSEEFVKPKNIDIEPQQISGRGGKEIAIPKVIQSTIGTTVIRVVDSGGDAALQKRFKQMSNDGDSKNPYENIERECPICKGTGKTRVGNKECPKCGGSGSI